MPDLELTEYDRFLLSGDFRAIAPEPVVITGKAADSVFRNSLRALAQWLSETPRDYEA